MAGIVPPWGQVLGNPSNFLVSPRIGQRQYVPIPQLPRESGHSYSLNDELEKLQSSGAYDRAQKPIFRPRSVSR